MPVNDFEKQVQQKMDELQLRPSKEVWEEVERRIHKEKKRRWFILWFFLLGALLLGGTGWWLVTNNKQQITAGTTVAKTTTAKKPVNQSITEKNDITNNTTISEKSNDETKVDNEKIVTTQNSVSVDGTTKNNTYTKIPVTVEADVIDKKSKKISSTVTILSKIKNKKRSELITSDAPVDKIDKQQEIAQTREANSVIAVNNDTTNIPVANRSVKSNDSVRTEKSSTATASGDDKLQTLIAPKEDSVIARPDEIVTKKDSSKKNNNKWETGITGMAGSSAKSYGISIFGMQKSLETANLINVNNPGAGGQSVVVRPAQPGNGFAWQLGAYAKRKLSAKTGVSIGLGFSSYSSTQAIGNYVDSSRVYNNNRYSSSVSSFYRSGTGNLYKNYYYYLQLPLAFHWQINKGKKLPIVFQNGFSTGYFISSNALVYNAGSNVFYKDNKSFKKLQLSFQSGVYAKLFNRYKNPLTAGFLFNYHLSKQQKVNIYGGNHLTSFGIQIGWILKK